MFLATSTCKRVEPTPSNDSAAAGVLLVWRHCGGTLLAWQHCGGTHVATSQDIELSLGWAGRMGGAARGLSNCDDTRLLSSSISTPCTTLGIALSLTIMPRGPSRRSAPSGPPALPLPSSAPTEHQPLQAPFHAFQPLHHPHVLPGHPGPAMNVPHYQPYGPPYYPPAYPPPQFLPGPGQIQPWDHAPSYFPGHPAPPNPASHLVAAHPGPGNFGPPPPGPAAPAHANRTRRYPNKLLGEGGK